MPIAPTSSAELLQLLRKSGVVPPDRLADLPELPDDPRKAAAVLVERGLLTRFQAQQLLAGRHKGFRVGAYAILDLLGRGGMGAVYLAEHLELHRKVAIKVLVPPSGRGEDQKLALERFLREARAAAALDHPNIVRIFDVCRHGETPYLVLEYVEGETLQQVLDRDGAIPYPTAAEYVAQAAAGLQHAHEKGFVHRDIKPGNLIRDRSGTIKILDMGLARSTNTGDRLTERLDNGAVVGTADFIAPEQGLNLPNIDIRADIYSLGATFFALITGKPPFEGSTTQKLLQHQLKNPPSLVSLDSTLPHGLSAVVAKMLAKKPEDRFQTPAEVIAALAPWTGSSARILAGLSRTNLAQGAALQATLTEIARGGGSSLRLTTATAPPATDSAVVDPTGAVKDTAAVAGSVTTRETGTKPSRTQLPSGRRSPVLLYSVLGIGLLLAGALTGWLVFGGRQSDGAGPTSSVGGPGGPNGSNGSGGPNGSTGPGGSTRTDTNGKPPRDTDGPPPPEVPPPGSGVPTSRPALAYRLDLTGQEPFTIRGGLTVDPSDPMKKHYRLISHEGAKPPAGWVARPWNLATEIEFFADVTAGRAALGIRNTSGPASAMLFMPTFQAPDGACRVRLEYQADVREGKFLVRFKPADSRNAWDVYRPPVTGGAWRTEEFEADLCGASGGFFEFHNSDERPSASIRIRSLEVTPLKGRPERVLFALNAADLPDFRSSLEGSQLVAGRPPIAPRGVGFRGWKPQTHSDWECGSFGGVRAVSFCNVNDVVSAQIALELESAAGIGLKINPGTQLRARVAYRTTGTAAGRMYFQTADFKTGLGSTSLPNSNAVWRTVDVLATRGDQPLRLLVDNTAIGAENALLVRSVTVTEVAKQSVPPAGNPPPTPPRNPADDLSRWTEGAKVYDLNLAAVGEFRVQKDKNGRLGGEAEVLPPGVGCHCWKDGSVGEFACRKFDGVPALGITNLNEVTSAQLFFSPELPAEGGREKPLRPGQAYRVRVVYQTRNEAAGRLHVRFAPSHKSLAVVNLENTDGKWHTATVSFVHPPAEETGKVRLTIDNTTVGEGNTIWVRSLEVVELVPPRS